MALNLLYVTARYAPSVGGTEIHVSQVARRMARAGHRVTVLTTDRTGALPSREQQGGIELRRVRAWPRDRDYFLAPGLVRIILSDRWDLVHLHGIHTLVAPIALAAARLAARPAVVTFHSGGHSDERRERLRALQWRLLGPLIRGAVARVAVSTFEQHHFARLLNLPPERIAMIPSGSELPTPTATRVAVPGRPLVVAPGRIERYKGQHHLVEALPELLRRHPDIHLLLIGRGSHQGALLERARVLGVAEHVSVRHFAAGARDEMAALLQQADLIAVLSEYESQGLTAWEAAALGRPLLVRDGSALADLVARGLATGLSPDAEPAQVAAAIEQGFGRVPGAERLLLPTWEGCVAQLQTLYATATGGRSACVS